MQRLYERVGFRNLVVLGLAASLLLGAAGAVFADEAEDPMPARRDDVVEADLDLRDDDDDEDTNGTVDSLLMEATGNSRDVATGTVDQATGTVDQTALDTGDATPSNDGTVGGDTTAAPAAPAPAADSVDDTRADWGDSGSASASGSNG